ncbi:DUF6250 domain-containing protein [Sphingomonas sanguinis]|uniref:DUF6250 domain-containing protein n=1 Tax=Sphingomonas sp. LC-1 TaxID=3110957 RepID=UPI0021BAFCB6|nr:DUF6250 domain-containing protein [Sphingomonas sp. LC-1]MCT8003815.1 DUF6250 domain-containing protein [Sphingomonas sp. LC-1]
MIGISLDRRGVLAGMAGALVALPAEAKRRPLYRDDFRAGLGQWGVEAEEPAQVTATDGVLDIVAPAGLTLWFRPVLSGAVAVEYDVQAVQAGGPHDRVSDVNCFWMARDPAAVDGDVLARPRPGRFEDYDGLETYYASIGGNANTTTRFRRYVGRAGDRPLLSENDRRAPLLVPNAWQRLRVRAQGEAIRLDRNGVSLFEYHDPAPYTRGRFALRTTASHLRVRNFAVHLL